jgi:hypothetical protein
MVEFQAWHGMTLLEHEALRDQWFAQGYRLVSLSIYGRSTTRCTRRSWSSRPNRLRNAISR